MSYLGTKPANSPLTSELIPDGLISTSDLADNSVTTAKIVAGAVVPADLSTGSPIWDTSGNLSFNSGYGSAATAYGCRAWVNFNGTGTVAIRASGNVSSITDNGTGDYTLNFATALSDVNYSLIGVGSNSGGDYRSTISARVNAGTNPSTFLLTTSARVSAVGLSSTINDPETCCVSIFR